jgi:hypothetical protein
VVLEPVTITSSKLSSEATAASVAACAAWMDAAAHSVAIAALKFRDCVLEGFNGIVHP